MDGCIWDDEVYVTGWSPSEPTLGVLVLCLKLDTLDLCFLNPVSLPQVLP